MPDPFAKVRPGDGLAIASQAWNAMLDVVRPPSGVDAAGGGASPREAAIIRVKNESGANLARCSVLGLDGPVFTPDDSEDAFLRQPAFRGITPDIDLHRRRYCVLIDPAADGQFARAYLAGVCQVRVNLIDPSHEFANIEDATRTRLKSSRYGHAQILWTEADGAYYGYDTGEMWAIVRLGVTMSCVAVGVAASSISPRSGYGSWGTGDVTLYRRTPAGGVESAGETITVYNASSDMDAYGDSIPAGNWVSVGWDADGTPWVAPLECP